MNKKNSKALRHWLKVSAAFVPLSMTSIGASAGIIDVGLTTTGSATWGGSCGASCIDLNLAGTASLGGLDSYFGSSGTPDFTFSAMLDVTPNSSGFGSSASGMPPMGGWQLWDASGDSLHGSVNGWLTGTPGNAAGLGWLDLGITGGTGLFGNVSSGSGDALALFGSNGAFADAGVMFLDAPSTRAAVPEPGAPVLFAAALAALGWKLRRSRLATARHPSRPGL